MDANSKPEQTQTVTLNEVLRIYWLPPNIEIEKISTYLKSRFIHTKIDIKEIEKEHKNISRMKCTS